MRKDIMIFVPMHNTKKSDAAEFMREAEAFRKLHHIDSECLRIIDNHKSKREMRRHVLDDVDMWGLTGVFFFCHGWESGIQLGISLSDVCAVAHSIGTNLQDTSVVVGLYCCSTGGTIGKKKQDETEPLGGDGGFADRLRDELCRVGAVDCRVLAHTVPGHTTKNPYLREFIGGGRPLGGSGGSWVIPPRHKPEFKAWRKLLRTDPTARFEIPFVSTGAIQRRVKDIM